MENQSRFRMENGITIISLIITIIILLLLSGIAIATITGENGLLVRAKQAKEKQENTEDIENGILLDYEEQISKNINTDESGEGSELNFNNYRMCSLIPKMTSENSPFGIVDASDYSSGRDPFHAFNGNNPNPNDGTGYWFSLYNNSWLSYTWEDEVLVGCVEFYKKAENEFKVQYFNNGIWIDAVTTPSTSSSDIFEKVILYFPNIVKTKAIRFYCTYVEAETNNYGCALGNIKAYGIERVK